MTETVGTDDEPPRATATRLGPAERVRLRETERAILRARVVALERAVERRERRLESVIEQYEQILDAPRELGPRVDGDRAGDEASETDERSGLLGRLRSLFSA